MTARRGFLAASAATFGLLALGRRGRAAAVDAPTDPDGIEAVRLSDAEWRQRLNDMEYEVLREEGTERAYTSPLNKEKRDGDYLCRGCGLLLFHSKWKYDSGTGWPSFYDVVQAHIGTKEDDNLFYTRTEYHCARCGGHQGHVFDDGPQPTGLRYCNNGVALEFRPRAT
ncbi:MAG: peptide-methionine (R)-S-oxide reductase MsrB [Halofilum sp. (in: g-proteobacteria)]|nr:peptide-methionine (R)-S-oxide reductase MsrB [Halofilum sp. (in: g-proteobacteria)]